MPSFLFLLVDLVLLFSGAPGPWTVVAGGSTCMVRRDSRSSPRARSRSAPALTLARSQEPERLASRRAHRSKSKSGGDGLFRPRKNSYRSERLKCMALIRKQSLRPDVDAACGVSCKERVRWIEDAAGRTFRCVEEPAGAGRHCCGCVAAYRCRVTNKGEKRYV